MVIKIVTLTIQKNTDDRAWEIKVQKGVFIFEGSGNDSVGVLLKGARVRCRREIAIKQVIRMVINNEERLKIMVHLLM